MTQNHVPRDEAAWTQLSEALLDEQTAGAIEGIIASSSAPHRPFLEAQYGKHAVDLVLMSLVAKVIGEAVRAAVDQIYPITQHSELQDCIPRLIIEARRELRKQLQDRLRIALGALSSSAVDHHALAKKNMRERK